jgi:hypothetical protein
VVQKAQHLVVELARIRDFRHDFVAQPLEHDPQVERPFGCVVDQHDAEHGLACARTVPSCPNGFSDRVAAQIQRLR